jgi:hypothetical protein
MTTLGRSSPRDVRSLVAGTPFLFSSFGILPIFFAAHGITSHVGASSRFLGHIGGACGPALLGALCCQFLCPTRQPPRLLPSAGTSPGGRVRRFGKQLFLRLSILPLDVRGNALHQPAQRLPDRRQRPRSANLAGRAGSRRSVRQQIPLGRTMRRDTEFSTSAAGVSSRQVKR